MATKDGVNDHPFIDCWPCRPYGPAAEREAARRIRIATALERVKDPGTRAALKEILGE